MSDDRYLSATECARRISTGEVSPLAAVTAALERIAEVQPRINAFTAIYAAEAEAEAAVVASRLAAGEVLPLAGVPIAVKDFTPLAGRITTRGSRTHADWRPDADPVMIRRLRAAGAIIVARTTTPEFAFSSFTASPLWGVTRNPWNLDHTPGGSSGGSAAAVAAGCVPLAEGTDMGGSVRIPAGCCGIVGLKPSLGRIPMDILPTVFDDFSHFGPLCHTIADASLFLAVTAGPDDADIQSLPQNFDPPDLATVDGRGLRLALSADLGFYAVDPEVEANLRATAAALRDAGATVEEVAIGWTRQVVDDWALSWGVFLAAGFGHLLESERAALDPEMVRFMEMGRRTSALDYARIDQRRTAMWREMARLLARFDALLLPTNAIPAPRADLTDAAFEASDAAGRFHGFDMTAPFNMLAQLPALSVPSGLTRAGLPTAMQIVGHRFDDAGVLRIGRLVERLRPWEALHPRAV